MTLFSTMIENINKVIDFDNSNVYFTGHSLGGLLASLLAVQYNKQAIIFHSPGDKHYFDLIGLDIEKDSRIYHFAHNADSLVHGHCGNLCWAFGYNIETKCHIGHNCIFDAKKKLGLTDSITTHRLEYLINTILPHWETDFPECPGI